MNRAAIAVLELAVGLEVGAARAVPALVVPGVDVAVVVDPLHHLGDLRHVLRIGRADEEVVGGVQPCRQLLEADGVLVTELARRDPEPLGLLRDRLAVLVRPGEEEHVLTALAHVPREHVGSDRRVGVPEMGLPVHVVDGRGDVVRHPPSMLPAGGGCRGPDYRLVRTIRNPMPLPRRGRSAPPMRERPRAAARRPSSVRPRTPAARRRPAHASAQPRSGRTLELATMDVAGRDGIRSGNGGGGPNAQRGRRGRRGALAPPFGGCTDLGVGASARDGYGLSGGCRLLGSQSGAARAGARRAAPVRAAALRRGAGAGAGDRRQRCRRWDRGRARRLARWRRGGRRQHRQRIDVRMPRARFAHAEVQVWLDGGARAARADRAQALAGRDVDAGADRDRRRGAGTRCRSRRRSARSRSGRTSPLSRRTAHRRPRPPPPAWPPAPQCRSRGAARRRTGRRCSGTE